MPYLGNTAGNRFVASKAATQFSGDGSTTAFTLDHAVGSDEDILVSVDGVIQEPSVAYAVSNGTTLTFTGAPSSNSGNNIFVYYLFRTVATVDHPSTSALSATSGTFSAGVSGTTGTFSAGVSGTTGTFTGDVNVTGNVISNDGSNVARFQFDNDNQVLIHNDTSMNFYVNASNSLKIDANGHVTMPYQSAFLLQASAQTNLSTNATTTIGFSAVYDQNSDFDSSTETFTAPVTGKYQFNVFLRVDQVDNTSQYTTVRIETSNRTIYGIWTNNGYDADLDYITYGIAQLMDMDAGDTAKITIYLPSLGTAQLDVTDASFWSGYLVC